MTFKNKAASRLLFVLVAATASLAVTTCDQAPKRVKIEFKFQPDLQLDYQQVTRGIIQIRDRSKDVLWHDKTAEVTMDIEYYVRRILEDSTAEVITMKKVHVLSSDRIHAPGEDSTVDTIKESPDLAKYIAPNGRLVDIEYTTDTNRAKLDYIRNYYEQGLPVFPSGEVGPGHSWTQTTTVVLPDGPIEASTTYEIKSFARERGYDCVVIEYDGVSIIPLPTCHLDEDSLISGVDRIKSKGHLYFAYKEGVIVLARERWVLDSDRTVVKVIADTIHDYGVGDTVDLTVGIEYDVDYYLTKLHSP